MNVIPSVNLQDFVSGDPVKKQKFIDEIGKAYEEIGFVALKGHFLDDKLVDNLYKEVKNFFSLYNRQIEMCSILNRNVQKIHTYAQLFVTNILLI